MPDLKGALTSVSHRIKGGGSDKSPTDRGGWRRLFIYGIAVAIAFHLRVVFGEEPWLARTQGEEWERYAKQVPRWFWR